MLMSAVFHLNQKPVFDEYYQSYLTEGWISERPVSENKQYNAAICEQEKPQK